MKKNNEVYRDEQFVLGLKNDIPYLKIDSAVYKLTCHPYEPCLYITDENGTMTAVHNAFNPFVVLELFYNKKTITSITGLEYDAKDFCQMVEYAAGIGNITISDAEKVFGGREKKKVAEQPKNLKAAFFDDKKNNLPTIGTVIKNDSFYDIYSEYPDSVIDYCLIKNNYNYCGYESHRGVLALACGKLFYDVDGELEWQYDLEKAAAKKIDADELFTSENEKMTYRKAFLKPPHTNNYSDANFDKINDALFPDGKEELEIYKWSTDWSEYFDDGHEWWGTLCLTVYDKKLDRFAVIMASATD